MKLFTKRLCADWDALAPQMRKAYMYMSKLQSMAPESEFKCASDKLWTIFMTGVMDHELVNAAETSAPPADVRSVGAFRTMVIELLIVDVVISFTNLMYFGFLFSASQECCLFI